MSLLSLRPWGHRKPISCHGLPDAEAPDSIEGSRRLLSPSTCTFPVQQQFTDAEPAQILMTHLYREVSVRSVVAMTVYGTSRCCRLSTALSTEGKELTEFWKMGTYLVGAHGCFRVMTFLKARIEFTLRLGIRKGCDYDLELETTYLLSPHKPNKYVCI